MQGVRQPNPLGAKGVNGSRNSARIRIDRSPKRTEGVRNIFPCFRHATGATHDDAAISGSKVESRIQTRRPPHASPPSCERRVNEQASQGKGYNGNPSADRKQSHTVRSKRSPYSQPMAIRSYRTGALRSREESKLAARPGFEPGISAPKADVLPLHHRALRHGPDCGTHLLAATYSRFVGYQRQGAGTRDVDAIISRVEAV